MPRFSEYLGVDYSGAATADDRLPGLRIYHATETQEPREVEPHSLGVNHWSRRALTGWLSTVLSRSEPVLLGIDHAFSFPKAYFETYSLPPDWSRFLEDFCRHWPTNQPGVTVESIRRSIASASSSRTGNSRWRRLTDRRAGGAKSPFHFDVPGSVAKSTHAGLPWLLHLRTTVGDRIHFWPFDGWSPPPGHHVIAEVYPSLWKEPSPNARRTPDQQDAYAACRWLQAADQTERLEAYLRPPLTLDELLLAQIEGWILGVPTDDDRHSTETAAPRPL
jgi:hypothetical protein